MIRSINELTFNSYHAKVSSEMKERVIPFFKMPKYKSGWQSKEAVGDIMGSLIPGDIVIAKVNAIRGNGIEINEAVGMVLNPSRDSIGVWNQEFELYLRQNIFTKSDYVFPKDEIELIDTFPAEDYIDQSGSHFRFNQRVNAYTYSGKYSLIVRGCIEEFVLGFDYENKQYLIVPETSIM